SADEKTMVRRLSVFVGGFTLEAVVSTCGCGPEGAASADSAESDVIERLAHLLDKSLVHDRKVAAAEPRFFMLETIREYADEQLRANGETAATEQRHAYYYLQLAETAATHWFSKERDLWCERLDPEDANLRKALAWCKAEPRAGQ